MWGFLLACPSGFEHSSCAPLELVTLRVLCSTSTGFPASLLGCLPGIRATKVSLVDVFCVCACAHTGMSARVRMHAIVCVHVHTCLYAKVCITIPGLLCLFCSFFWCKAVHRPLNNSDVVQLNFLLGFHLRHSASWCNCHPCACTCQQVRALCPLCLIL